MIKKAFILLLLSGISLNLLYPRDTLVLDSAFFQVNVTPHASLLVDTSGHLTITEVINKSSGFVDTFNLTQAGDYPVAYWLHIPITAKEDIKEAWIVASDYKEASNRFPPIDYLDAYYVDDTGQIVLHEKTGYLVPKSKKTIKAMPVIAVVPFAAKVERTLDLYIRLQQATVPQSIHLELEIRQPSAKIFKPNPQGHQITNIALGMLLVIGLYAFVFYSFVRDKSYLFFGIFCWLYALDMLLLFPNNALINLLPEFPKFTISLWYLHFFSLPFLLLFGYGFVNIKRTFPKWEKYYLLVILLFILVAAFYFIRNLWPPYQLRHPLLIFATLLPIPFCIRFIVGKKWTAQLFAGGFFCFLGGNIIGAVAIWSGKDWGFYSWIIGLIILLFIYAAGLGYRLLESQWEKASAEKIKELDALKTRFFTNISHEFRTPLSLILGPLQKAAESVPQSDMENAESDIPVKARHIQLMKRNALRLQQLIDQILDLSKIESGKMSLNLEQGEIVRFVRLRVAEFTSIASQKNIHLVANYGAQIPQAFFDPDKVEKILFNILSNAIKFTPPKGEIRVQVEASSSSLKIKITDTGPGMSDEEAAHLFDRFFQADEAQQQGSGIGMALVKELIDLHLGQITVESQKGAGTIIACQICIDPNRFSATDFSQQSSLLNDQPATTPESHITWPEAPSIQAAPDKRIVLVVEDHEDLQLFIQEILQDDYFVITATNGREGIDLAIEKTPDVIISDIMMPEVTGLELCDFLKKEEKTSHIPIILLTAKADRKDKLTGLKTGADDYLTKPFDSKELQLKVTNLIRNKDALKKKYSQFSILPEQAKINSLEEQFLHNVQDTIKKNMANEFYSVEELGQEIGYSRSQLFRKLKALTGKGPLDLIKEYRLAKARQLLEKGAVNVTEAAFQVGYSNLSYFSKSFKDAFGIAPSEVARGS